MHLVWQFYLSLRKGERKGKRRKDRKEMRQEREGGREQRSELELGGLGWDLGSVSYGHHTFHNLSELKVTSMHLIY